ncbi:MAG: ABC transporter permease [Longibaculum sp.]
MSRILKTELYKLKHNKAYWAILLLAIIAFVGLGMVDDSKESFNMAIASSSSLVPIFGAVVVIGVAQADYSDGTMKNVVSSGISRPAIYIGKMIAAFIGSLGVFLIEAIVSVGFVVYNGSPVTLDVLFIVKSILLQMVIVANYTVVYFLLGSIIRSSALAISISFVFYLFGAFAFGYVGNFLHISGLLDYELGTVATAVEQVSIKSVTFMHLGVVTCIILVVGCLGMFFFSKQEIK